MTLEIVDVVDVGIPGPAGTVTPAAQEALAEGRAARDEAVQARNAAQDARAGAEAAYDDLGQVTSEGVADAVNNPGAARDSLDAVYGYFRNVRDAGVKGDGSDETAAIQAAVNGATGVLFFPAGTYRFRSLSLTSSDVMIQGEGDSTHLLSTYLSTDSKPAIRWIGSRIGMRNLKLEAEVKIPPQAGFGSYDLLKIGGNGTDFEVGVTIDNVTFIHGGGCNAYRTSEVLIQNSRYVGSHGNSFGSVEVRQDVQIINNVASYGNDDLIAITCDATVPGGTQRAVIANNVLHHSDAKAIACSGVDLCVISANSIEMTYAPGIQIFADSVFGLEASNRIQVINNVIRDAGKYFGEGAMHANAGTAGHGIYIAGDEIKVLGNTIMGSRLRGITCPGGRRVSIGGNTINGAGQNAIFVGNPDVNTYDMFTDLDIIGNIMMATVSGISVGCGRRAKIANNSVSQWGGSGETRAIYFGYISESQINDNLLNNTNGGTYGLRGRPGAANPQCVYMNNPVLVPDGTAPEGGFLSLNRRIGFGGNTPPTAGTWNQGDVLFNQNMQNSAGTPIAYICTASGTPGTWIPILGALVTGKKALPGPANDLATVIALANATRSALISYGFAE